MKTFHECLREIDDLYTGQTGKYRDWRTIAATNLAEASEEIARLQQRLIEKDSAT